MSCIDNSWSVHELVQNSFSVLNSLVYIKKRKIDGPTRRERLKAGKRKPQ